MGVGNTLEICTWGMVIQFRNLWLNIMSKVSTPLGGRGKRVLEINKIDHEICPEEGIQLIKWRAIETASAQKCLETSISNINTLATSIKCLFFLSTTPFWLRGYNTRILMDDTLPSHIGSKSSRKVLFGIVTP